MECWCVKFVWVGIKTTRGSTKNLSTLRKQLKPPLNRAIEHLTGVKGEEEDLEYGENIHLLFEENKKFHYEVDRLKKMRVDFGKPSSDWAEVLYRIAWRQEQRYVGERVSWLSTSNKGVIQAHIISIDRDKQQFKLRALDSENYKVKDKNGILRKGADKVVGLFHLLPPKTTGEKIYKKQMICHGCCRMRLKGSIRRGLDYDNEHWYCSGCNIMSFEICHHMKFKHIMNILENLWKRYPNIIAINS